ncbi:MAG TPA: hypothetical protein VFM05_12905, partial [Candidatus Saccharimonadales bacterium]|nr:hypothetical protein [Candidatus Saccharimonadales bacterium]
MVLTYYWFSTAQEPILLAWVWGAVFWQQHVNNRSVLVISREWSGHVLFRGKMSNKKRKLNSRRLRSLRLRQMKFC